MTKSLIRRLALSTALSTALLGMMAGGAWAADPEPMAADPEPMAGGLLFTGMFDISVGGQDAREARGSVDITEGTVFTIASRGAVNIPLGDGFSAQLDGQSELYDRGDNQDDASGAHTLGGHLSLRDPDRGLVGLFAGAGMGTSIDSSAGGRSDLGYLVGAEAQAYLGNFTLYGQVGYADIRADDDPEGFVEGWFVSGEVRYFINDDFVLHANVAYGETDSYIDGNDAGEIWNWGVGGKMRLSSSMPIYGTLDYRGGDYDSTTEGEAAEEHVVLVGLSFLFEAPSLMENDRRGATLSTPMLPARAAAWTEALD